jgi:hypothetical protein
MLIVPALAFGLLETTRAKNAKVLSAKATTGHTVRPPAPAGKTFAPQQRELNRFEPLNFAEVARQEALAPMQVAPAEIRSINPPSGPPERGFGVSIVRDGLQSPQAPPPSATGSSPGPSATFEGEFLSGTTIPPDTTGVVGTTHVVTPSNNNIRIQTRNGVELSRMSMTAFWAGATVKGVAIASAFDTKVYFDRFNNRFILISSLNGPSINSGAGLAVTQTADPTGLWNRFTVASDPASTASAGHAIDYPSVGFNKNWVVVNENVFNYSGASFTSFYGQQIFVFDKQAAYANTLGSVTLFEGTFATCLASGTQELELGCGFTMVPSVVEDNTTNTEYLIEDWDSTAAQLRMAKITGPLAAPVLTVGTQFPQSALSWRFDAARLSTSGGYLPQRDQFTHATGTQRIMANDSRIQNAVLRAGSLWTTHTVMLAQTPTLAGVAVGGAGNPDTHSAIQWWQIDPTQETGASNPTSVLQRARIEDTTATNCHNGSAGTSAVPPCNGTATAQFGQFYAYPNIAVNQNNDVVIGFSQFSNLTYASAAYAYRANTDPINTTRDPAIYRPGQSNYNLGAGTGNTVNRQNRWGDYSGSQTDPLNDTDFWVVQEYAGARRDFGIGIAGPWETWYALIKPSTAAPSLSGNLIISEFRLRGPQGVNDEFVELYNPGASALMVNTTDNSDGWSLAYSTTAGVVTAVAVIPNGTVIPAKGHLLIARDQDPAAGPTLVYSLNTYPGSTNPSTLVRGSDSDVGYAIDNADNGGFALFKTSTVANFSVATRMDSVGFASTPAGLFKEGTGIPDIAVAGLQQTLFRNSASGSPKDTDNNVADFIFADPAGTLTAAGQRLGAPGPENLDSPIHGTTGTVTLPPFDNSISQALAPNFVYDPTAVANGTAGTLTVRRRLVNNTGAPLSRVRLRFVDITTFPQPLGVADLRVLNSSNLTVEIPPAQALGGGLNSSVSPPVVTFAAPIANGADIPIDFVFGVMQTGCFHFIVIAEAPGGANTTFGFAGTAGSGTCVPTAAPANISGRISTPDGSPLAGVTVDLGGGRSARAITDSQGNYHFNNISTENFYTVTPSLVNYHFGPESRSYSLLANVADAVFTATPNAIVTGNAIDTPEYFVRQHYLDFLGREPDESGFNFWSDQITSCGSDAACIEHRTINVSAAYFLSIEFQNTGGLVDGLYRASYGRRPSFTEFMPDTATVAQGVIVGSTPSWPEVLLANKEAFVAAWVQRPAFQAAYGGLANGDYVDTLISHTSGGFNGDRAVLVNGLNAGTLTRAAALRQIAENDGFVSAKRNETFVMMQYFGYLRREPDAAGFAFWLNKLNQFNGNFEQAEMVKAFLVSGEYRQRFGR